MAVIQDVEYEFGRSNDSKMNLVSVGLTKTFYSQYEAFLTIDRQSIDRSWVLHARRRSLLNGWIHRLGLIATTRLLDSSIRGLELKSSLVEAKVGDVLGSIASTPRRAASDGDGGVECLARDSRPAKVGSAGKHSSNSEAAGQSSRRSVPSPTERLTPFRFNCDGTIEELPDLAPSFDRSRGIEGQDWDDVAPTHSTLEGVSLLMEASRASGVTFMIPRSDQRPWSPPVGYCCVYESFFGEDSRLWFPIPRLITSFCFRRGIAISQLMNGAVRIAVALMVMAAEIDVSLTVRIFEELTQVQPKPNGLYSVQMRSGLNVFTSPLIKIKRWQRSYFYVKADDARFVDPLDVDRRWVIQTPLVLGTLFGGIYRRSSCSDPKSGRTLTAKEFVVNEGALLMVLDWAANVPCEEPKGKKRLKLPIMGTPSRVYPDYSEILAADITSAQLRDANCGPSANTDGTGSAVADTSIDQAPAPVIATVDSGVEGSVDIRPPKKKRKRTKSSKEVTADPPLDGDEREAAQTQLEPMGGDEVEEGDEVAPIEDSTDKFAESLRADAELGICLRDCAAARKNALVMEYEKALQRMTLDLKEAEETIKIKETGLEAARKEKHDRGKELAAERGRYSRERRQAIQTAADLEEELETARSTISRIEAEKVEELERTKRAMDRMRQSRNRELLSERSCVVAAANRRFDKFRKYITDRDEKEEKRLLHGTALGTLDALSLLEKKGLSVPQQLKDLLTANEAKFKKEVEDVSVEVITEHDLALSPPRRDLLPCGNQFGSTFGTVDSGSATVLRSPVLCRESSTAALDPAVACRSAAVTSDDRAVTQDSLGVPIPAGLAEAGSVVSSEVAIEE
ncbi:meiosis-specific protein ASY2 [Brassica rapa]|uniref:meiosis-specific protein ASY2 n=1 Tax=Brassica campestris TaxID=3711 RepID=UPI00142DB9D1|nr:meiosis-specific protein ASY2 [Brassica rapa]